MTALASVDADSDNGLEPRAGVPRHRLTGPKYADSDELAPYLDWGQSLVVYHHLHRSLAHESQVRDRLSQVEERLGPAFALRFRPGTGRCSSSCPQRPTGRCSARGPSPGTEPLLGSALRALRVGGHR